MADLPGTSDLLGDRPSDDDPSGLSGILGPRPSSEGRASSTTEPPQGFRAGGALWTGPESDAFHAAAEPIGRVLRSFGQGAEAAWEHGENLGYSDDVNEGLKKAGVYNDVTKGQGSLLKSFNEALIRPAVSATFGLAGAFGRGIGAAVSGAQAGVVQAGEEVGQPGLARDLAALPEAFPLFGAETGGLHGVPTLGRGELLGRELGRALNASDVDRAAELGIVGPQARSSWQDTSYGGPVTATQGSLSPATVRARVSSLQDVAKQDAAAGRPVDDAPLASPEGRSVRASPEGRSVRATTDIHEAARNVDPETFAAYDPLVARVDGLRDQIAEAQAELRRSAEAQAPHQAEIADLQERLQDATPRLTKKYEARLAELVPARDAFLANEDGMALLTRDTPEIQALRQQLQAVDYQMRDLAPDVTAAYREAAKQFPESQAEPAVQPAAEPAVPAAEIGPTSPGSVAAETPATAPAVPSSVAPTLPRDAGPAGVEPASASPVNIREEVAQKLMAAGRPADEARASAEVVAAGYETRAARFGGAKGTPGELYRAEAPDIVAGRNVARVPEFAQRKGRELEQAIKRVLPADNLRDGLAAAARALDEKTSIPEAMYREDIGDITFDYGKPGNPDRGFAGGFGFSHIVARRGLEGVDGEVFVRQRVPEVLAYGRLDRIYGPPGGRRVDIVLGADQVSLSLMRHGERETWVVTAFRRRASPGEAEGVNPSSPYAPAPSGIQATEGAELKSTIEQPNKDGKAVGSRASEYEQTTRGKININNGHSVITLMKDANASTFMHETGHDWLEKLLSDAKDERAPAQLVTDSQTVRSWLGADPEGAITTAQHEKFARGFERYLMEGTAPSRGLAGVFAQFKSWLTSIYQTVARLRAPISDDIRQVFDRMLAMPEETTVIARDRAAQRVLDLPGKAEPAQGASPYLAPGKEPLRLTGFLRRKVVQFPGTPNEATIPGGVRDPGGDIAAIIGGAKGLPGLINNATGSSIHDAMIRAWEHGYFPEHGEHWNLEDADLLRKIEEDHASGVPQYSIHDQAAVEAYHAALAHNAEVDRLADEHGIDPKGMTSEQFFDAVAEKVSEAEVAESIRNDENLHTTEFDEASAETRLWLEDHNIPWDSGDFYGVSETRSLEDLEAEHGQENAARSAGQSQPGDAEALAAGGDPGQVQEGAGPRRRGAGPAGRADAQEAGGSGADSAERRPTAAAGRPDAGGDQPAGPHAAVEETSDLVDKAGNIRLDNLNSTEDVKDVLRQLAEQNDDFQSARGGVISDVQRRSMADALGLAPETFVPVKPLGVSPSVWAEAVQKLTFQASDAAARIGRMAGESGSPADLAAYLAAKQRLLLIADHFSSLTAEAGRTLRVFDKAGFAFTGDLVAAMQRDTGRTLFQMQQEARAVGALETTAQRSKMLQDTREPTRAQTLKSGVIGYFINNLISGPITHAAYAIGNTVTALFKAVPLTLAEASLDTIRQAMSSAPLADRVYFGEVGAQVYGAMHGAWAGFSPGVKAFKSGISFMEGADRLAQGGQQALRLGEALGRPAVIGPGLEAAGVPAGIAGAVGHVLETPSRAVSAIHTVFYSMNYEREIARRAFRAASNEALAGQPDMPTVAPGSVRFYHGGVDYAGGSRFLTEDRGYAQGYADKSVGGKVHYVDLPEGHPALANVPKSFDDTGTGQRAPYVHFDAPESVASKLRPVPDPAAALTSDRFATRVAELTQDPPLGMVQAAHDEAMSAVLMQSPTFGSNQQKFVSIVNNSLPLKLAMPFMQVGMNILDEGLIKNTPLALASQSVRDDLAGRNGAVARSQAYARIGVGSGIVGGVMAAAADGLITGSGPTDQRERALKEATGWKADSIRIGDTYVPIRKYLGPLGVLVSGAASIYEVGHLLNDGQVTKAAGAAMLGFAHTVADETWMAGLSSLVDAVTHWDTDGEKYLRNLALSFIPFSVGDSQVARMTDEYQREVHSWLAAAQNKLPGLSEGLMPQRDWTGTPVGSHTMLSPSTFKNDGTMAAMQAAEFFPAKIRRDVRGVPLTDQQYDDLARVAGGLAKMRMDQLVRTPGFLSLPEGLQRTQMQQTLASSRKAGEDWLMLQPGNENILRQATDAKAAKMQGKLPEDVKSIRRGANP